MTTLPSPVLSALANPALEESFHMSYTLDAVIRPSPTAGDGPKSCPAALTRPRALNLDLCAVSRNLLRSASADKKLGHNKVKWGTPCHPLRYKLAAAIYYLVDGCTMKRACERCHLSCSGRWRRSFHTYMVTWRTCTVCDCCIEQRCASRSRGHVAVVRHRFKGRVAQLGKTCSCVKDTT